MSRVRRAAQTAAGLADRVPAAVASVLLERYFAVVCELARRDARYAAIEDRLGDTLDLDEFIYQFDVETEIRDQLLFERLVPLLVAAERGLAVRALASVRYATQRLRRGYDDRVVWGLDRHLCHILSQQLTQLADEAHGWPGSSSPYPTFEDWTAALRQAANGLGGYAGRDGAEDEQQRVVAAQQALRWVADNLPDLWD